MTTDNEGIRLIFGLKLKVLRQQRGINYQQLSEKTGIAVSYLHSIENGKKYPKADKIIILAKALDVDYDYLVSLTANKRLQPIIDIINTDFTQAIPWEHLGVQPSALLDLFADAPDKMTAFISTILKLSRSMQVSKGDFYMSALRSYQDIHDNYFENLELAAQAFREKLKLKEKVALSVEVLEGLLSAQYGIKVDRKVMATKDTLVKLRSFYAAQKKILYLNKGLSQAQEKFLLAREIGFQNLQLSPRPYETVLQDFGSFEILLNNFNASYFANALLLPEDSFTHHIKIIFSNTKWSEKVWLDLMHDYDVTPEMLVQRLTNILPKHFGLDQLFFLRLRGNIPEDNFEMTKELHLSRLHSPYANNLQEHYCRRWVSIHLMKDVYQKNKTKKYKHPLVGAQISQYWQTHNRYLCITFAKPQSKVSDKIISVTLGILIDSQLLQRMPFVNDLSIPVRTVHTTCERCGIMDCKERAALPVIIEQHQESHRVEEALKKLAQ
ncbi:XRE family transcriptional regulator [Sphingobacteriaceae bacterium]|nr:XRE family transcriptional regulator [Sphingobacteriaceae bacterium]